MGLKAGMLLVLTSANYIFAFPIPNLSDIKKHIQQTPQEQKQRPDTSSCEGMAYNSPKAALVEQAGKNVIKGAIGGAAIGALLSKDKAEGAIKGALIGAAGAMAYTMAATQQQQREDYDTTAKRLNYKPEQGELISLDIHMPKREVKVGEYAEIILRVSYLTPEKNKIEPVTVNAYLSNKQEAIPIGQETYNLEQGTSPIPYYLPICNWVPTGEYNLVFEVVGGKKGAKKEVNFKVVH